MSKGKIIKDNHVLLEKLDAFFLNVGGIDSYRDFAPAVVNEIRTLIAFDQAVTILYDAGGSITDCRLLGVSQGWALAYQRYYVKLQAYIDFGMEKGPHKLKNLLPIQQINWSEIPENEFIRDCIKPRGVSYSVHLPFFDLNGQHRLVLALDRTRNEPYSGKDINVINRIAPHLDNLHRKFFLQWNPLSNDLDRRTALMELRELTRREKEIVTLLCEGVTPALISRALGISTATTQRHIANIYKKLNVDTLQALLVRMLHP